jgi:hypothetical protein
MDEESNPMHYPDEPFRKRHGFFDVLFDAQTYKNLAYSLLAFPTGLAYFLFISIGLALGGSLAVVLIGLPILLGVVIGIHGILGFERALARELLDASFITPQEVERPGENLLVRSSRLLISPNWIKGVIFLFLKFPFGIGSFVLGVITLAMMFGVMLAPIFYTSANIDVMGNTINSFPEALAYGVIGLIFVPFLMKFNNATARVWRTITENLLGEPVPRDYEPAALGTLTGVYDDEAQKRKNDLVGSPEDDSGYYYDPYSDSYQPYQQVKRKNSR